VERAQNITAPLAAVAHRRGLAHVAHGRALQIAALRQLRRQIDAGSSVADVQRVIEQSIEEYAHELRTIADQAIGPMDFGLIRTLVDDLVADLDEGERHARAA
jgi:hypothetical protein